MKRWVRIPLGIIAVIVGLVGLVYLAAGLAFSGSWSFTSVG